MDPIDNEWLGYKNDHIEEAPNIGNVARSWQWREQGIEPLNYPSNKTVLENVAEDILVQKPLKIRRCELPGYPRSTFLMVFSPDGTKVASTHGNHNIYVSELASGKHVRILKGHPRTPWCIAFHPSHPQLIGSGCLGGQVRVWDISSGGSEVWNVRSETVIASIAFHPREQLLVIATFNELYFWDWNKPAPFTKVTTNNANEKIRYVAFDALGYKLITGISQWVGPTAVTSLPHSLTSPPFNPFRREDADDFLGVASSVMHNVANNATNNAPNNAANNVVINVANNVVNNSPNIAANNAANNAASNAANNTASNAANIANNAANNSFNSAANNSFNSAANNSFNSAAHNSFNNAANNSFNNAANNSFNNAANRPANRQSQQDSGSPQEMIVNSYQNLVQRYDSLVRNYQRLYMVRHRLSRTPSPPNTIDRGTDPMETDASPGGYTRLARPTTASEADNSTPSTSRVQNEGENNEGPSGSNRFPNFNTLSLGNMSPRDQGPSQEEQASFGSGSSAFQPLTDYAGRPVGRTSYSNRLSRMLLNPFSPTNNSARSTSRDSQLEENSTNSSRTSIFISIRPETAVSADETQRRPHRGMSLPQPSGSTQRDTMPIILEALGSPISHWPPTYRSYRSTSQRPTMINSSTQMSPVSAPMEARTINESLDLIRDILRDSGTRLLNLITNMSLATLANMERNNPHNPRRGPNVPAQRSTSTATSSARPAGPGARRDPLSSSSDSESDQSMELNIFRTPNTNVREDELSDDEVPATSNDGSQLPTDRMTFELNVNLPDETGANGINLSASGSRFHIRTHKFETNEGEASTSTADGAGTSGSRPQTNVFRHNVSSTSRDTSRTRGNVVPPREIYRRVKSAVNALQRHTLILTNLWLHGHRITMTQLRNMWDNLRRRVLMLQRQTGHQDVPTQYTRTLLERCMILTQMSENLRGSARTVNRQRPENNESDNRNENRNQTAAQSVAATGRNERESTPSSDRSARQSPSARLAQRRSSPSPRYAPHLRQRLMTHRRWTIEDEVRRRLRNPTLHRLTERYGSRPRREFARALEISATKHEIRMRAMQVLSVMFNMMMMCLEERGLSHVIINMLRTLKKALALTCLMLMSNRRNVQYHNNPTQQAVRMEALNVVRIEHIDHTGPINVDESPNSLSSDSEDDLRQDVFMVSQHVSRRARDAHGRPLHSPSRRNERVPENLASMPAVSVPSHRWSNRLAVQISAANRNNSITAINRRKMYLERKRQKALHRTNPLAHPLLKKKVFPPTPNHRIPALRSMPRKLKPTKVNLTRNTPLILEPIPGPSSLAPGAETAGLETPGDSPRTEILNDLENRVNLIRLAHLQTMRMRNARRHMETIRVHTPSSVMREMFARQPNRDNRENQPRDQPGRANDPEPMRRPPPEYLPPPPGYHTDRAAEESPFFPERFLPNGGPIPIVHFRELPYDPTGNPAQRLPRIHEYLQPIILAQNAMLVEEDANGNGNSEFGGRVLGARRMGGMAGLLDAGIISETMPAPAHRVQAWDFTAGATPDIADSNKNVVVRRCRIHNDASIDISKDGRLLVALLPVPRFRNTNHLLGVYSLEWSRLGHCLHTAVLEQSPVSVALSPTSRHLAVGLGSRRFTTTPHARNNVFAQLYRLDPPENTSRTGLAPIKELEQNWEHGFTSLNCLRWAPQPGQGLVYANNTGQLIIMS